MKPSGWIALFEDGTSVEIEHDVKSWPDVFFDMKRGAKVHEYRKNDRDYRLGDLVLFREFVPTGERYTGEKLLARITSLSVGPEWGIPVGYAVFSINVLRYARVFRAAAA